MFALAHMLLICKTALRQTSLCTPEKIGGMTMNYIEWSQEYWLEAQKLEKKVAALKKQLADCCRNDENGILDLKRRIATLYSMYLDCVHTAKLLFERGEREYARKIDA